MTRIQLEAASDLVERLAYESQPLRAVIELIWNGLDADAHHVVVTIAHNEMDSVTVQDDGHGMSPEDCASSFRRIGGSWKLTARRGRRWCEASCVSGADTRFRLLTWPFLSVYGARLYSLIKPPRTSSRLKRALPRSVGAAAQVGCGGRRSRAR